MARFVQRRLGGQLAALACALLAPGALAQDSSWVKTGTTGRLIYVPDAQGDRIPDFSMVGYGAGKREIPDDIVPLYSSFRYGPRSITPTNGVVALI